MEAGLAGLFQGALWGCTAALWALESHLWADSTAALPGSAFPQVG